MYNGSIYEVSPENVVHENGSYVVDVGMYPGEQLECYRIWNKDTGVLEYAHSVLFYATQWADEAAKILSGTQEAGAELPGIE